MDLFKLRIFAVCNFHRITSCLPWLKIVEAEEWTAVIENDGFSIGKAETTLQGEKIRRKIRKTSCNAPDFLVYYISRLAWAPKMARMRACLDSQRVHRKG